MAGLRETTVAAIGRGAGLDRPEPRRMLTLHP
jgi:hypothetical protein